MTDTQIDPAEQVSEAGDPFTEEGSKEFSLDKDVSLAQLQAEIIIETGVDTVTLALVGTDPDQPVSADNPAVIYVTPDTVDGRTVRGCITSHVPDPTYFMDEAQIEVHSVVETLLSGEDLDLAGINIVLRGLMSADR